MHILGNSKDIRGCKSVPQAVKDKFLKEDKEKTEDKMRKRRRMETEKRLQSMADAGGAADAAAVQESGPNFTGTCMGKQTVSIGFYLTFFYCSHFCTYYWICG